MLQPRHNVSPDVVTCAVTDAPPPPFSKAITWSFFARASADSNVTMSTFPFASAVVSTRIGALDGGGADCGDHRGGGIAGFHAREKSLSQSRRVRAMVRREC